MKNLVVFDFESQSGTDIKRGLPNYFADPKFSVLCLGYALSDKEAPAEVWRNDAAQQDPDPTALLDHIENGGWAAAHNALFEYRCWEAHRRKFPRWPVLRLERLIDTRAMCAAAGIPQSLAQAAKALGFAEDKQKSTYGARLIRKCCCPPFDSDPALLHDLAEYCRQDVVVEREILHALPMLTRTQHEQWCRTQRINLRGVAVDIGLVRLLAERVKAREQALNQECFALTGYNATQVGALLDWVNERAK